MRKRADRGGGGTPYARQAKDLLIKSREFALMIFHDDSRSTVQVAAARVITEAAPVSQHLLFVRRRECCDSRKRSDEALEIRNDGGDLGLLQHDL